MSYVDRPDPARYADRLEAARTSPATYDTDASEEHTEAGGWRLDHHERDLPPEPPGEPLPNGSFAIARRILRDYDFPDPRLITGIFSPDEPLEGRPMLLRARFLAFTFWFAVRVSRVVDEVQTGPDGPTRVWGFGYYTLEGHFERGHITFAVRKALDTGRVSVWIDAVSRPDRIANPFYRLGFKLFGRRLQLRFARTALDRIERFVRDELAAQAVGAPVPARDTVDVEAPGPEQRATLQDARPDAPPRS